jgi:uncharacterized protein (UPF0216 family)
MYSSKHPMDRALDALMSYELRRLNNHLPKEKRCLSELLELTDPTIEAVDGSLLLLKTVDLQELSKVVPKEYWDRVQVPFVILRRTDLGRSIFTVVGGRFEELTVQKILGNTTDGFHELYKHREQMFLYRPEVTALVMKLPSLIVIGFGVSTELADYVSRRD